MSDAYNDLPCVYFSAAEGLIVAANETLCQALQYTERELVGRKLESIFTLATRIFQQTHFYPLLQMKGHAEEIYLTLRSKGGLDIPVLINALLREKDGQVHQVFAGITVDKRKKFEEEIIAAKKAAEKALNENTALKAAQEMLQKRAEELDTQVVLATIRNEELSQFNHLATHTFQEPLRKLLFFSSQLLQKEEGSKEHVAVQKIRLAAEDMHKKLRGLQQYLWLTSDVNHWEQVDLHEVIAAAHRQQEIECPGVSLLLHCEAMPLLEANMEQMQFLVKELLANAVRFRKLGAEVGVKISASTLLLNKFRQVPAKYKYAEFLKLQVQDNGIGFDGKYGEQAFDLFGRLHAVSGGGLGLSLCKKIVANHGGSIDIESETGLGTKVILFLPISQDKGA